MVFGWKTVEALRMATVVLNLDSFGVVESADLMLFDTLALDMRVSLGTEINRTQPMTSSQLAKRSFPTDFPLNKRHAT